MKVSATAFLALGLLASPDYALDTAQPAPPAEAAPEKPATATLKFKKAFPESPGIFQRAAKRELVSSLGIHSAAQVAAFDAAEAPMAHRGSAPEAVEGNYSPSALRGKSNGIMLWGPYTELPAGHYLIVYRFQLMDAPEPGSTVILDVAHNACTRAGISVPAADVPTREWQEYAVPVFLTKKSALEFRFWPNGNDLAIDRLYVFKTEVTTPPEKPVAGESLPTGLRDPGNPDVCRSPHTDSGGAIDISGLEQGTRVRCPYTGKYFLTP